MTASRFARFARCALVGVALVCMPASAKTSAFGFLIAKAYGGDTIVVSPTSLNDVLHVLKDASRGQTAREIEPLLFNDGPQQRIVAESGDIGLSSENAIWIDPRYHSTSDFERLFQSKYHGTIVRSTFANGDGQRAIAAWITRLSGGDLHGFALPATTRAVVANITTFHGV